MRRTLALCAAVALLFTASCGDDGGGSGSGDDEQLAPRGDSASLAAVDGPPPWPLGSRQADRIEAAGITGLQAEGTLVHYHAHLDVFYDGKEVEVPANVGIDAQRRTISPLHTHSDAGVIHVEADRREDFTIGQFLTQWGVESDGDCVADKCGDEATVFVNGSIRDEPVADLVIEADTQIALVLGTPPADIPSGYDCSEASEDACPNVPT